MGIIRRESSDVSISSPQQKQKQVSMELTDVGDNEHVPEDTIIDPNTSSSSNAVPTLTSSPSMRPTILPPLQHNPLLRSSSTERMESRLSTSLDSRLSTSLDSSLTSSPFSRHESSNSPLHVSEGGRRTLSMDEMRSILMTHKQRVISRLESLGYDPYKGVYVKHRKWLMTEKDKAVHRLEELGIDPLTGSKKQKV